jgi:MerR HTH family regulatory protein
MGGARPGVQVQARAQPMSKPAPNRKRRAPAGRPVRAERAYYTLEVAAQIAGVPAEQARVYWKQGLFGPRAAAGSRPVFDDDALYELRRIEYYRRHYGVSRRALPLLSGLLREVARLEAAVRFHQG